MAGPTEHQLLNGHKNQTMIIITGASKGIGKYLFNTFLNETSQDVRGTYFNSVPEKNLDKKIYFYLTKYIHWKIILRFFHCS